MEPTRMRNDFGFPHEGWHRPPIRPGHPARWRVYRPEGARGTLTATAKCTSEDGTVWEDVEVVISQDFEDPRTGRWLTAFTVSPTGRRR